MPRGRKPKSAYVTVIKTPEAVDSEIESVEAQIAELKVKLAELKKERIAAVAAKEQEELKLLGEKIRESGKSVDEWLKEFSK